MVIKDKEMRASVHHNLRNPLTIIKGNIELLMIYRKRIYYQVKKKRFFK